jgi:hypothetical protein
MREFAPNPLHGEPPIDVTNIDSGLPKIEPKPMTLEERVAELEWRLAVLERYSGEWPEE